VKNLKKENLIFPYLKKERKKMDVEKRIFI